MNRRRLDLIAWLFVAIAAAGCNQDLPKESLIEDTRIIGAKVVIANDTKRAWLKPGEKATVSLLTVNPSIDYDFSQMESMALTCSAARSGSGIPLCSEWIENKNTSDASIGSAGTQSISLDTIEPIDCALLKKVPNINLGLQKQFGGELACGKGQPKFEVATERDTNEEARLLLGVTCDQGHPYLDVKALLDGKGPEFFSCDLTKDGRQELWNFEVQIAQKGKETNHHPVFTGIYLDGKSWPKSDVDSLIKALKPSAANKPWADCAEAVKAKLVPGIDGSRSEVTFAFKAKGFEKYTLNDRSKQEELWVSHYTTAGELARPKSVLTSDAPRAEVTWKPPSTTTDEGGLVQFFFTVSDRRGGFDSTSRVLCVTSE